MRMKYLPGLTLVLLVLLLTASIQPVVAGTGYSSHSVKEEIKTENGIFEITKLYRSNSLYKVIFYITAYDGCESAAVWDAIEIAQHNDLSMFLDYWSPSRIYLGIMDSKDNNGVAKFKVTRDTRKFGQDENIIFNPRSIPFEYEKPDYTLIGDSLVDKDCVYILLNEDINMVEYLADENNVDSLIRDIFILCEMNPIPMGRFLFSWDTSELKNRLPQETERLIIITSEESDWNGVAMGNSKKPIKWCKDFILFNEGESVCFTPYDPAMYSLPAIKTYDAEKQIQIYADEENINYTRTSILAVVEIACHEREADRLLNEGSLDNTDKARLIRVLIANIDCSKDADWAFLEAGLNYLEFDRAYYKFQESLEEYD